MTIQQLPKFLLVTREELQFVATRNPKSALDDDYQKLKNTYTEIIKRTLANKEIIEKVRDDGNH